MKKVLFILFLFVNAIVFGQGLETDSLLNLIKTDKDDTNKVIHCNTLCRQYIMMGNFDTALDLGKQALALSQTLSFKKGIAQSHNNIGNIYFSQGNYPAALKNHFAALKIRDEIGDQQGIANSYNNIGNVYAGQGNYPEALKNNYASLKINEQVGNQQGVARSYNNLGNIYALQGNYPEALKTNLAALKITEQIGDLYAVSNSYNNIGSIYQMQDKYPEALENHFAALKIREDMGNKEGMATSYINIGGILIKQKKSVESNQWLQKALSLSKEIGSKENVKFSYQELAMLDSMNGNYKQQVEHYKLYILYRDSLDNEETQKKTIQSQMTYDFEKKEIATKAEADKQAALAEEEQKKQQLLLVLVSCILILVFVFAVFMYRRFKITQKQKVIIEQQKSEVEAQKHLVEEKQNEILDSITYAKRLQEAILPPNEFVNSILPNNFIYYQPKDIIAGDFYWAEKVDNLFFIAAADSTGHGVPGAMVSVVCSNALNRTIKEFKFTETGKILDKTRELVIETFEKSASEVKDGMDISLLCVDSKNKNIFWSGANNPLWFIQDGELRELKADKQPIGKTDYPKPFTTHQIEYKENTAFYLFTDGLADQFGGPKGKKFKYKQFSDLLIKNSNLPQKQQADIINKTFLDWKGVLEQVDDVCVIGIKL